MRCLLCLAAALVIAPLGSDVGAQPRPPDWAFLGPIGPGAIRAIAVAPEWPQATIILARRDRDLIRSMDGGTTWVRLAAPAPELIMLTLSPEWRGQRVAFAIGSETLQGAKSLYRSGDSGTTWQLAIAELSPYVRGLRTPAIVLAPTFAVDGLVLLVADGTLYRSDDGGVTWTDVTPPGQVVQQAMFSPAYARDHRIYLATSGGTFPDFLLNTRRPATGAFDLAAGVMVSMDRGDSWQATNAGLQVDEVSYRNVQALAMSPAFDQDGTLLAYAWAERLDEEGIPALTNERALFRSTDAGLSWDAVHSFVPPGGRISFTSQPGGIGATYPEFALSPRFFVDGIGLFAVTGSGGTPSSGSCRIWRTADKGATWELIVDRSGETGCLGLHIFEGAGERYEIVYIGSSLLIWQRLPDGGGEPTYFTPSGTVAAGALVVTPGPPDQQVALLGSRSGGIWAFGAGMTDTEGQLPCTATTILGFNRVWQTNRSVRRELGCPTDAEHSVQLWETIRPDGRPAYGMGDSHVRQWYTLTRAGFYATSQPTGDESGVVTRSVSDQNPWPDGDQRIVQGAVQQFEGGEMLWVPQADGSRLIIVVGNPHYWQVPD